MTPTEALCQCIEAMKLVDFKDCAESEELWHKFNLAQANAEHVLRDGGKQEPVVNTFDAMTKYRGTSIATTYWMEQEDFYLADDVKAAIAAHPAPSLQAVGAVPEEILKRTEKIRQMLANPTALTKGKLEGMAECLLAHIAFTNAPQPAAAPSGDVERASIMEEAAKLCDFQATWAKGEADDEDNSVRYRNENRERQIAAELCASSIRASITATKE